MNEHKPFQQLMVVTPVKDAIDSALQTVRAVLASEPSVHMTYAVYDDNSAPEGAQRLEAAAAELGFTLHHLADLTPHPSPNYLFVLRRVRHEALAAGAAVCLVESDVTVRPDTLRGLVEGAAARPDCGIAAAVTVDEQGAVNYPYLHARDLPAEPAPTAKHCSFCCSLLTPELLRRVDFDALDDAKHWFDVTISHLAQESGLTNYLFCNLPVVHRPHQSRPWKQLKHTNPLKYYWLKYTRGLDKI